MSKASGSGLDSLPPVTAVVTASLASEFGYTEYRDSYKRLSIPLWGQSVQGDERKGGETLVIYSNAFLSSKA